MNKPIVDNIGKAESSGFQKHPLSKQKLCTLLAMLLGSVMAVWSQATNSADLTGTVTDTSGAVIPNVSITVKDVDKGVVHSYQTNQSGLYDTGPIVPDDHYVVTFKLQGFETLQRGPMILRVGRIGMNVELGVGQATQQVVVNESAPLLETATPELSSTLPEDTLQALPQVGSPDWQQNIVLLPGTKGTPSGYNNTTNPGMGGVSANGSMPFSTALLDGAMSNSPQADNVIVMPVFDAIAEVKISDSMFSAQYPTGGILYNQITKGGSNSIHGMAYDYIQNTAFKAATYAFGTGSVAPLNYNDFGGNLGGPALKSRVFLFFDWDHTISHGGGSPSFINVPTEAMRRGNFTGLPTIYDPTSQIVNATTGIVTRKSFADENGNGNVIPTTMLDSVAKKIQAYFPAPTPGLTGTTNNYEYILNSTTSIQKYFGRIDADITPSNRITGSASHNQNDSPALSPVCPIDCDHTFTTGNVISQLSDVWTLNTNLINEARVGFYGEYDNETPDSIGKGYPTQLGLQFAKVDAFPMVNVSGFYELQLGTNFIDKENLFDLSDTVTWIHGKHVVHAGGQAIIERVDATDWGGINPSNVSFNGGYTASSNNTTSTTGSAYADFLLGYVNGWSASNHPEYGGRQKGGAAFVQDDWKATPKLTFNLGLRWEGRTGWSEVSGNSLSFDPTLTNPANGELGAMWYQSTHANGRTALQSSRFNNWLPRIGVAYQLTSKTTVRSGFGIYSFPWSALWASGQGSAYGTSGSESDSTSNAYPVVMLSADGNTNYQGSKGSSINSLFVSAPNQPQSYNGQSVGYEQYHTPIPILKEWNLDIQRQLTDNMMAEVAYIGSRGTNLPYITDLNQVPVSELGVNDSTYRPYQAYQSITGFNSKGVSNYNGFEAVIARRMSNGIEFNFNYTWSHMLSNQDSSGWNSLQGTQAYQNAYDPSSNYGASNFDVRNMFKGQVIYELPFGKGRKFFNQNQALNEAIGGWTLSGTWLGQGGNPFTPYMLTNNSYALSSNMEWYPNQVGNPKSHNAGVNGWFNTDAYAAPTAGTLGNTRRNSVYGPGLHVMNMAIRKNFPIYRNVSFNFSASASNVLNHPSFGLPDQVIGTGHSATIRSVTEGGRSLELVGKLVF
ncbi:TonB-dependent receptor domain-containing protein [Telmatobacter bradus]|uniref:TonB-dependent receptor domain-containing protein n=1 Tax=Telmatobacter bradus TaxID=474953 RepID=UPI003B435ACB